MNEPCPSGTWVAWRISSAPMVAADHPSTVTRSSVDRGAGVAVARTLDLDLLILCVRTPQRHQRAVAQDRHDIIPVERRGQLDRRAVSPRQQLAPAAAVEQESVELILQG